ncbi:MAG TPA: Gfo/Idh/MocA family oxidoreductase [Flavobacteriales bacterium]|nr:Gfo/Idh/MocA family oxidoreductase [Flavobacteriales bacterium]
MLKIAVVGAGHLGKIHIRLIKELNDIYELVGLYDADTAVSKKVEEELGVKSFVSLDELLEKVQVVDVVTPTVSHHETASLALKKFKHVFIEKPVTETIEQAKNLLLLETEANVKVQVGHVERFNPAFIKASTYISNPLFIETHRLAQFNPRGTDVSVVLDLMIHDLDIILSVVNANIRKISASGVAVVSDTPDIANARLEFDNGCVANITSSRISLKNMRKSRFFQRDAYISIDFLEKTSEIVQMAEDDGTDPFALTLDLGKGKPRKKIVYNKLDIEQSNAIKEELRALADSINQDNKTKVSLSDGFKALDVAYQIIEKIEAKTIPFTAK